MDKKIKTKIFFLSLAIFITGLIIGTIFDRSLIIEKSINFPLLSNQVLEKNFNQPLDSEIFWQTWNLAKTKFVDQPVSDKDLFYGALSGIIAALKDPHSIFLTPEFNQKFKEEMSGTFEGIGIEIGIKNNHLTVIAPLPETPAEKAGLRSGDVIDKIDNVSTANMSLEEAVRKIRGKKGTVVTLSIQREGWTERKEFKITRAKIEIKTVTWQIKPEQIVYLKISQFNDKTYNDFLATTKQILIKNPKAIILDLRNNPGGYLDSAVEIASFWLGDKLITYSKNNNDKIKEYRGGNQPVFSHLKTVILVNSGTASGAEIIAGAFQDYKKATLIGEKTFGKGSIQELIPLPDGSAVKITTAYWYTPNGRKINNEGINPDIEVKMTDEDYNQNKDPQLDKAMEMLSKELN